MMYKENKSKALEKVRLPMYAEEYRLETQPRAQKLLKREIRRHNASDISQNIYRGQFLVYRWRKCQIKTNRKEMDEDTWK